MNYTIKDLTTENGRIFHLEGGIPTPFMDTPPINVVAKDGEVEAVSEREYSYSFRLNAPPDETWQEILRSQLGNFVVAVDRDILQFEIIPANLTRYETLKKAIETTNSVYAQKQQNLIARIQEKDKQEAVTAKLAEQSRQQAQKSFNDLEL
jgi:hypothetical protein